MNVYVSVHTHVHIYVDVCKADKETHGHSQRGTIAEGRRSSSEQNECARRLFSGLQEFVRKKLGCSEVMDDKF